MKYSVKFIDNFNNLKDLNNIRTRISNEFEPIQELDKFLLLEGMLGEGIVEIAEQEYPSIWNIKRSRKRCMGIY